MNPGVLNPRAGFPAKFRALSLPEIALLSWENTSSIYGGPNRDINKRSLRGPSLALGEPVELKIVTTYYVQFSAIQKFSC